jgi:hypothetical protein
MPVAGVTAMLRMTAPPKAAGILMSMPADRIQAVLTAMEPADLGRILATAKPERAVPALCALAPERIALILMATAVQPAARFLAAMPTDLVSSVLVMMPAERAEQLVAVLRPAPAAPPAPQASPAHTPPVSHHLSATATGGQTGEPVYAARPSEATPVAGGRQGMAAPQAPPPAVLVPQPVRIEDNDWLAYERGVVQALGSTAAQIVPASEELRHCVLVKAFGWLIAVTIEYREFTTLTLPDLYAAEETASRAMANAALTVTNVALTRECTRYNDNAAANGRPVAAVTWTDGRDNGRLQRAVVRLVR